MAAPSSVVIDTNVFFALLISGDKFHHQATEVYDHLVNDEQELWTTSYVLSEAIALLYRRFDFDMVAAFVERFETAVQVYWVDSAVHQSAWRHYAARRGAGMNFVDWTVAVVAENMNAQIFTFDGDFSRQGYSVVPR